MLPILQYILLAASEMKKESGFNIEKQLDCPSKGRNYFFGAPVTAIIFDVIKCKGTV